MHAALFFHIIDGQEFPDLEGTELVDDAAAKREAILAAVSMLREDIGANFWRGQVWTMRVENVTGSRVCELRFSGTG